MNNTIETDLNAWREFLGARVKRRDWLVDEYLRYVEKVLSNGMPPILDLGHLSALVGIERNTLSSIIINSGYFYHDFSIEKKRGGFRKINVPLPSLLTAQRWILRNILNPIDLHECAHGFVLGRSIITNATPHLGANEILRMDLKDFFPSIPIQRGLRIFNRAGYSRRVSYYLGALCFLSGGLPQGAATSPAISNIIAKKMDARLAALSVSFNLKYTRYADDLTFSGEFIPTVLIKLVAGIVVDEGFCPNTEKTNLIKGNRKKIVTGISVSGSKLRLPRESKRKIKGAAHALLKFGIDDFYKNRGKFDPMIVERLIGKVQFWQQIDDGNPEATALLCKLKQYQSFLDNQYGLEI